MTSIRFWGAHAKLGLAVAAAVFLVDALSKTWLLHGYGIGMRQPVAVTPFLDVVLTWNLGISYGLVPLRGLAGQLLLAGFSLLVSIALWVWLSRTEDRLTVVGLALVIGGALGNALDRVLYGGVADFFSLHLRSIGSDLSWYVFNLADVAIVAGVGVLLYESLLRRRPQGTAPRSSEE
jgi:signal peptidase II